MKRLAFVLVAVLTTPFCNLPKPSHAQVAPRNYAILDVTFTKSGEVDYVDGLRVPEKTGLLNSLMREQEVSSPRNGLMVFVPSETKLGRIEDIRAIAGKMQYEYLHIYLYESDRREFVVEVTQGCGVDSRDVRMTRRGPLPWPDTSRRRD